MNRFTFYLMILLVLVGIYLFAANTSIFKRKPSSGANESFDNDDDDSDEEEDAAGPPVAKAAAVQQKGKRPAADDAASKGAAADAAAGRPLAAPASDSGAVAAPTTAPDGGNSNVATLLESIHEDLQFIKGELAAVRAGLPRKQREPQGPAFESFYAANYY